MGIRVHVGYFSCLHTCALAMDQDSATRAAVDRENVSYVLDLLLIIFYALIFFVSLDMSISTSNLCQGWRIPPNGPLRRECTTHC